MRLDRFLFALMLAALTPLPTSSFAHDHEESAVGKPGVAVDVSRTVKVSMTDAMRFEPAQVSAKQGETIRFVVTNAGKVKHEFVLGTETELKEHYEAMLKSPDMVHSDPNRVTLAPGAAGEIIWTFTKTGNIDFACLQPGHYDAGMKGIVAVTADVNIPSERPHGHSVHEH